MTWFFVIGVLVGVYLVMFSTYWFSACIGMELSVMCFIPIVVIGSSLASEAMLMYFLIQAGGSMMFLVGGVSSLVAEGLFFWFIMVSLTLKLGAAPLHFWYPMVSEGLSWSYFYLLSTAQKFSPLILLAYSLKMYISAVIFMVVLGAIVSAAGGVNELSLRKLLSYSSIMHMSWMILPMAKLSPGWFVYFLMYCLVLGTVVIPLSMMQLYHFNQVLAQQMLLSVGVGMLSLGGLPPLLGFLPKWLIFKEVSFSILYPCLCMLILFTMVTLYFYMRLSASLCIFSGKVFFKSYMMDSVSIFVNMTGMLFTSLVWFSFSH